MVIFIELKVHILSMEEDKFPVLSPTNDAHDQAYIFLYLYNIPSFHFKIRFKNTLCLVNDKSIMQFCYKLFFMDS